jgi:hypothetical protein
VAATGVGYQEERGSAAGSVSGIPAMKLARGQPVVPRAD